MMPVQGRAMKVEQGETGGSPREASSLARWTPLAVVVAAAGVAYGFGLHRYLTLDAIAAHHGALHQLVDDSFLLAMVVYVLSYVAATALSLPGAVFLTILGGFLFGWAVGGAVTVVAATLGASILFLAARSSFGDVLARKAGPVLKKIIDGFAEDAFNYLLFLRLVPLFPFWLVNIAPALVGVKLETFVIATFIGIIPATFAFATLGSGLDSIIAAQTEMYNECVTAKAAADCMTDYDPGALLTPQIAAAFVALGIMALIPVALRRRRARKQAP
jgi:uncharacterized membrane protein YdjX (TVP38/TMEM64 family)